MWIIIFAIEGDGLAYNNQINKKVSMNILRPLKGRSFFQDSGEIGRVCHFTNWTTNDSFCRLNIDDFDSSVSSRASVGNASQGPLLRWSFVVMTSPGTMLDFAESHLLRTCCLIWVTRCQRREVAFLYTWL